MGLEKDIGYKFKQKDLLESAILHSSPSKKNINYQRLEFLGDSILSWIISNWLYRKYPNSDEGELNSMRSLIVNGESLAKKATTLKLGKYIKTKDAKFKNLPTKNMLEDTLESIIGSIYLDSNITKTKNWVLKTFSNELKNIDNNLNELNPKGKLQEWSQLNCQKLPRYQLIEANGPDHKKVYKVKVYINEKEVASGIDSSIKNAEIKSAKNALKKLLK